MIINDYFTRLHIGERYYNDITTTKIGEVLYVATLMITPTGDTKKTKINNKRNAVPSWLHLLLSPLTGFKLCDTYRLKVRRMKDVEKMES